MARGKFSGPRHGCRAHRALVVLCDCGAMIAADWMTMSAFPQSPSEFDRDVVQQLLRWKLIGRHGDGYRILDAGLQFLGVLIKDETPGVPVSGRYVPPRRELSSRHRPVQPVIRPGAFDYRDIPSNHAGKAVAYHSSITVDGKDGTA